MFYMFYSAGLQFKRNLSKRSNDKDTLPVSVIPPTKSSRNIPTEPLCCDFDERESEMGIKWAVDRQSLFGMDPEPTSTREVRQTKADRCKCEVDTL